MSRWLRAVACAAALGAPAAAPAADATAVGVVRSDARVEVKARVAAPIRRIAVQEGDVVQDGALLVEMAGERERAEVARAGAEVQRAEAAAAEADVALDVAQRELARNLKVPDLLTGRDLDRSRDAVRVAEAEARTRGEEVARARAGLGVAGAALDDTLLRAPFPGMVARVYLRPGATPRPAETTILDLVALDRLYVEVALPLAMLPHVRPGLRAAAVVEDEQRALAVATTATVRHVYPEVDATTRMFRVKLDLYRADARILPGMFARVDLSRVPAGRAGR